MSQIPIILTVSLFAAAFAGGATWVFIDLSGVAGRLITAWSEKRRLRAEARAVDEAQKAGNKEK